MKYFKLNMEKNNRKGFTLIELLAVIVILSILILLAMPSVLRIMENARKNAFKTEISSYLKAAQTQYAEKVVEDKGLKKICFQSSDSWVGISKPDKCSTYTLEVDGGNMKNYFIVVNVSPDSTTYQYYFDNDAYKHTQSTSVEFTQNVIDSINPTAK